MNYGCEMMKMHGFDGYIVVDSSTIILSTRFLKDVVLEAKRATCMLYDLEEGGKKLFTTESNALELVEWAQKHQHMEIILRNMEDILSRLIIIRVYDQYGYNSRRVLN